MDILLQYLTATIDLKLGSQYDASNTEIEYFSISECINSHFASYCEPALRNDVLTVNHIALLALRH